MIGGGAVPSVAVGIMSGREIRFSLSGEYTYGDGSTATGDGSARITADGEIEWGGRRYRELAFCPKSDDATFTLHGVTIGKKFHWERSEDETFAGALRIIVEDGMLTAINDVDVETYLMSVISSEMSASSPMEYLKTQAVVSRSWVARILQPQGGAENRHSTTIDEVRSDGIRRIIRWYENDAHTNFNVCADDHCQRYEGMTRALGSDARAAVEATRGEVLWSGGEICDARFSKCCGGATEMFSTCWADTDADYLQSVSDAREQKPVDLSREEDAEAWIRQSPEAFCNTDDREVLSRVLNEYDIETHDFYRWTEEYSNDQLSALLRSKTGFDFGEIVSLTPVKRGAGGHIAELLIRGTKLSLIIGKELEIRRSLSPSHLKSSAFVVDYLNVSPSGIPTRIKLTGAGWGHGVGLCQIGAAVMAARGYSYRDILLHYFKNTEIKRLYE